ncbi:MAG: MBL fold metallo-hydrolase [Acidobacteriota bacterium]
MKIAVLGSGSSGNSTWIETGKTRLLVDAGFGPRSLSRRLREAGLGGGRPGALLLTHGHSDHVGAALRVAESFRLTIYVNAGTLEEVPWLREWDRLEVFRSGDCFSVGDVEVESFSVHHDSLDPVGFRFRAEGITGLLATDFGEVNPELACRCRGCDWLILESNHDEDLLRLGPYPWFLKRRVAGANGHLSNRALAEFLTSGSAGTPTHLFLAHLSRQNNLPELALSSAQRALAQGPQAASPWTSVHLTRQEGPSIVVGL